MSRSARTLAFTDDDEPAIDGNPCHTPLGASDSCDPFGQEEELNGIFQLAPSVSEYFVYIRSGVPGTDLDVNPDADVQKSVKEWKETYANDWRFLATDETFQVEGHTVHGVKLPTDVLKKIYRTNAEHWIKGLP